MRFETARSNNRSNSEMNNQNFKIKYSAHH